MSAFTLVTVEDNEKSLKSSAMGDNSDNVDYDSLQLKDTTDTLQSRLENTEAKLRAVEHDHSMDLETALIKLEEVCLSK